MLPRPWGVDASGCGRGPRSLSSIEDSTTQPSGHHEIGLVFVHGAGLGGWIWEAMAPELDFPHLFTEFPRRDAAASSTEGLGLNDYARHVRDQVDELPVDRLAIVARSLGGVVALKLAEALSDRLAGFAGVGGGDPQRRRVVRLVAAAGQTRADNRPCAPRGDEATGIGDPSGPVQRLGRRAGRRGRAPVRA